MSNGLPGAVMPRLACRLFGRPAAARVFEPLVADWQREWHYTPTPLSRLCVWIAGACASLTAVAALSARTAVTSPTLRPVLRQAALWSALFSIDAVADARHLPWATATVANVVSMTSWLPGLAMGSMWQSGRYARMWDVGLGLTLASAAVALLLAGWGQPLAAVTIDSWFVDVRPEHLMTLPELLTATPTDALPLAALRRELLVRIRPAVFALLSGTVAVAHLRSGRRRHRVFSASYVLAGTMTRVLFVPVANAVRGIGVDRSMALLATCGAVMLPATALFVVVAEHERRLCIRTRGRRMPMA